MEQVFFRIVKSVVMAAIMMASAWALTGSVRIALVAGLVPFVLGMTNIMTGVAYSITAGVFLLAIAVQIIGFDTIVEVKADAEKILHDAEVVRSSKKTAAPAPSPAPAPAPAPVEAPPQK